MAELFIDKNSKPISNFFNQAIVKPEIYSNRAGISECLNTKLLPMNSKNILLTALTLLAVAVSLPASAATVNEPFSEAAPGSTVPVGWFTTNPQYTELRSLNNTPYLTLWRTNEPAANASAAVYYAGNSPQGQAQAMQDVDLSVIMRLGGGNAASANATFRGVVLRTQSATLSAPSSDQFWGYSIGFIATGANRGLYVYENPTGVLSAERGTLLASSAFTADLASNVDYIFRVQAEGSNLNASLWSSDGLTELASVSYADAIIVSGGLALRSANSNSSVNTYYRDLSLTYSIPEPAHTAMAAVALAAFACMGAKRLRKRS